MVGQCSKCGKRAKLMRRGRRSDKPPLCRQCWDKEFRFRTCKHCGHKRRIYAQGHCQTCYMMLGLNSRVVKCRRCGRERQHYATGLCRSCYAGIQSRKWQKAHPDKFHEYVRRYLKKKRAEDPEKFRKYWRDWNAKQPKGLTPERTDRLMTGTSFITTDDIGLGEGKILAKCVGKFDVGRWGRAIVYQLPRKGREKQMFKVQLIHIKEGSQTFMMLDNDDLHEFMNGLGIKVIL